MLSGSETAIILWFVVAGMMQVLSTLVLAGWLVRRKVRLVLGLMAIPGYLEWAYVKWCRSHGRPSTTVRAVLVARGLLLVSAVVATVVAIPIFIAIGERHL